MTAVLLDTHTLIWLMQGEGRIGVESRRLADGAALDDGLFVSAISFWEVALLTRRRRISLSQPPAAWRRTALQFGVQEIPVTGDIGIVATELEDFPRDPADRIIAASATVRGILLLTADSDILAWGGLLKRHDARK